MFRSAVMSIVLAIVPSLLVVGAVIQSADAATRCVSFNEFSRVHRGMTLTQVRNTFEARAVWTEGHLSYVGKTWKSCDMHHAAIVNFSINGRAPHFVYRVAEKRWTAAS